MNKVPGEDLKHYVRAMSSLEVAQITGKQHKNVIQKIESKLLPIYQRTSVEYSPHLDCTTKPVESTPTEDSPHLDCPTKPVESAPTEYSSHLSRTQKPVESIPAEYAPDLGCTTKDGLNFQPIYSNVKTTTYKDKYLRDMKCYQLSKEATVALMCNYSMELAVLVARRWLELEDANSQLVKARVDTKEHFHSMMDALDIINQAEYNRPAPHYLRSNNCDMLNKIVIGMSAKKYRAEYCLSPEVEIRNHFTDKELKLLISLEITNTTLIRAGLDYTTRKVILNNSTGDTK